MGTTWRCAALTTSLVVGLGACLRAQDGRPEPRTPGLHWGSPAQVGMDAIGVESVGMVFARAVARDQLLGAVVLVARHGQLVLHEAYGWRDLERTKLMEVDTLFRLASNTKALTAAAVLALAEDGELALDDPIHEYFPTFDHGITSKITVRHLMTHTSGLRIPTLFLTPLVAKSAEHPDAPGLLYEVPRFGEVGAKFEPGTTYAYNNPGYNTLAGLVQKVSGQPFADFLRTRFYEPLGMSDSCNHESVADPARMSVVARKREDGSWTATWTPGDGPGVPFPRGSGGMISTARDFAVFCDMLHQDGEYAKRRILSVESVRAATTSQRAYIEAAGAYGLGWSESQGGFSHTGSDGTWAWCHRELGLTVIGFTQSQIARELHADLRTTAVVRAKHAVVR